MQLTYLLPLMVLVHANKVIESGTLCYMTSRHPSKAQLLGFEGKGKTLVATDKSDIIHYYSGGAMWYPGHGNYLTVNDSGMLTLGEKANLKLRVAEFPGGNKWRKGFYYEGDNKFQLCADGSVRYKSNCEVKQEIVIFYEKDLSAFKSMQYVY